MNLLKKELKFERLSFFYWTAGLALTVFLSMMAYPIMKDTGQDFTVFLEAMPKVLLVLFGMFVVVQVKIFFLSRKMVLGIGTKFFEEMRNDRFLCSTRFICSEQLFDQCKETLMLVVDLCNPDAVQSTPGDHMGLWYHQNGVSKIDVL